MVHYRSFIPGERSEDLFVFRLKDRAILFLNEIPCGPSSLTKKDNFRLAVP